jgi:hypothetical protein
LREDENILKTHFFTVHSVDSNTYDLSNIKIYFSFNGITVESISRDKSTVIAVRGELNIDPIYSQVKTSRLMRPWLLVIQGIISLFLECPITIYDITESGSSFVVKNGIDNPPKTIFQTEMNDYSKDLEKVLFKINDSKYKNLSISLLDRWRKNLNLENEDLESNLYRDEALLGLFQILELLSNSREDELKKIAESKIKSSLKEYASLMLTRNDELDNYVNDNYKIVSTALGAKSPNFSTKIKYLLSKNGIDSENDMYFVESVIKLRNAIAHGRFLFQPIFRWPLTPFFNISQNVSEFDVLRSLVKRLIGNFFEISTWNSDYTEVSKALLKPPIKTIQKFMKEPETFKQVTFDTLESSIGNETGITWANIYLSYIENPKKLNLDDLANSLKRYFFNLKKTEDNIDDIFVTSVIFMECSNDEVVAECYRKIEWLLNNTHFHDSSLINIMPELDFHHIQYPRYKKFIEMRRNIDGEF